MKKIKFDVADSTLHFMLEQKGWHAEALKKTGDAIPVSTLSGRGTAGGSGNSSGSSSGTLDSALFSNSESLKNRMTDRRERDRDGSNDKSGAANPDDHDKASANRYRTMAAYAFDVTTGELYVGYSGGASVVAARGMDRSAQYGARLDRIEPYVRGINVVENYDEINCAEVAALSNARARGADIRNLAFCAMHTDGTWRDPCGNCLQWVQLWAFAYMNRRQQWIACRRGQ